MSYLERQYRTLLISVFVLSAAACFPSKTARVAAVAYTAEDVARAAAKQSDPALVRAGTPAYLMLLDGLIEASPDNGKLLVSGCQAYSTYASLFTAEAEQTRTGALYARAREYGFRALSTRADLRVALSGTLPEFSVMLQRFGKGDVPALFCTASSWARWTAANLDNLEALAELPLLEATMERILELDESYSYGSPHLLLGTYLAAKPAVLGGDMAKAKEHFDRALALADGKFLPAKVLYAKYYVRRIQDRELFVRTLEEVLSAPSDTVPELTLSNAVAKEQAKELLEKTDEYFGEQP
jgi:tetratricopeptide (TPR) repeat protein